MKGTTKRHLKVSIHIPDGGKHAGSVDFAIDPEKITEADREWAADLMMGIASHLADRRRRANPVSFSQDSRLPNR